MNDNINKIKKDNELLIKEANEKYYENSMIESELSFIEHLQEMRRNNYIITNLISFVVITSVLFGFKSSFEITNISDLAILLGSSSLSIVLGSSFANIVNNFLLKDVDLNNKKVLEKQDELNKKIYDNIKELNRINSKLISNNNEIERINYVFNFEYDKKVIKDNYLIDNKPKKLVRKKIV